MRLRARLLHLLLLPLLATLFSPCIKAQTKIEPSQIKNFPLYLSNPSNLTQDSLITNNYDNLFSYVGLSKSITNVSNSIGLANIFQTNSKPGAHGAYGLYNVADYTNLNGGFGWGIENDTYFLDTSLSNSNNIGAQLNSATVWTGTTTTLPVVTGIDSLVVNLGNGVVTSASGFLSPGNLNLLGLGSLTNSYGFEALDQLNVGTSTNAGFFAAAQTSCSGCYGFLSATTNKDSFGITTVQSLNSPGSVQGATVSATTSVSTPRFKSNGSVLIAGDFALSGGWGTTATVSSINNNASDAAGDVTISSSGTGQGSNPTVVLTFHDGTWTNAPICVAARADLTSPLPNSAPFVRTALSATTITWTFEGTPVAGNSYVLTWVCLGH